MELFSAVCASHNQWDLYNVPLIESFRKWEPSAPLVMVDSGSYPHYPDPTDKSYTIVRTDNESHCKAINLGLLHAPVSEWYLTLDNDTLITGKIGDELKKLEKGAVYGAEVRHWRFGNYAVGWCFAIPRRVMLTVGLYDENYIKILYEETDYCYRALQHGFGVCKAPLPVTHINGGGGSRQYIDSNELTWINLSYFLQKYRLRWELNVK